MEPSLGFIFITCLLSSLGDVGSAGYLSAQIDYRPSQNNTYRHSIEFWPDYTPLKQWVRENDECPFNLKMTYVLFDEHRLKDYQGLAQGVVPVLDLHYFRGKNFIEYFENLSSKNRTCRYDSVWFDPSGRIYGFHGFKVSTFDWHHNYTHSSYAAVPFVRNIDTAFIDERNWNTVYVSNNWYYAFSRYDEFVQQGRLGDLWTGLPMQKGYVDSILITENETMCHLFDSKIQCHPFDRITHRYIRGDLYPRPFNEVYRGGNPRFPWKGSFWIPKTNKTAFLDFDDVFWVYDEKNEYIFSKDFCEFMDFGRLDCCDREKNITTTSDSTPEYVEYEEEYNLDIINGTFVDAPPEEILYSTVKPSKNLLLEEEDQQEKAENKMDEWGQFMSSVLGGLAV